MNDTIKEKKRKEQEEEEREEQRTTAAYWLFSRKETEGAAAKSLFIGWSFRGGRS